MSQPKVIVTCMDARVDPLAALGLELGDAYVIRNAGGVITDDVVRSLCLAQRRLGTREIVLMHHTDCGVHGLDEQAIRSELADEVGQTPDWSFESFGDPFDDVRQSSRRLADSPYVDASSIRGFVYDVVDHTPIPVDLDG